MNLWTKILSRSMIVLSVFTLSGCFVNEVKVTGSLAPTSLGLSPYILVPNKMEIDYNTLDPTNSVDVVSSLSIDLTTDCSATYVSADMMGFAPAEGKVNLDGTVLTAVSSWCAEPILAQSQKTIYAQTVTAPMSNSDFFKSCTGTETCENLRIAIFILEDANKNTYGLQLELLGKTETSAPLTLLTLVGDGKLEYYGEIITSNPSPSTTSQISTAIETLLSLGIDVLNTSKKNKKSLTKNLQDKKGATKGLDGALNEEYWTIDNTLTEAGGDKVFKNIADAMKKISKAKATIEDESDEASISVLLETLNDIQASLVESMRALAADRIAAAQTENGNAGQIATASLLLAEGDALVTAGKIDKTIKSYGDAWNELSGAF